MHCTRAREVIAGASVRRALEEDRELMLHVSGCPACEKELNRHVTLLEALAAADPPPLFRDLAPEIVGKLPAGNPLWWMARRWATAAALAMLTLATGYLMGARLLHRTAPPNAITATYQEAFSGLSSGSVESAYLAGGTGPAHKVTEEMRP